jgi:hypothetical protein
MKELCSIHITKESHEVLQNLSNKYGLEMRKLASFCILQAAKEINKDHTKLLNLFTQEKITTAPPTHREIIDAIFDRAALEGRVYVWQYEIHKALKPKSAADPQEIDKLGYMRYIPEGQRDLAWMKN